MAAITSIVPPTAGGSFAAAVSTLTASDTITFTAARKQLLVVDNATGSSVTLKIDGDGGSTVAVPGVGPVTVSGGYDIVIANGAGAAVVLGTISAYCKGVVTLTGASGATARLFNL
jgi:hypothetical protein